MTQFNRVASVQITTSDGKLITFRGLRITFKVDKTEGTEPNTLTLEIYNLGIDTRKRLRAVGENVTLFAGYADEDGEQIVFTGDITGVTHAIENPEVITTIAASDGKTTLAAAKITVSQKENASGRAILAKILSAFDIGNNLNQITFDDKTYEAGFAFAGLAKKALAQVTKFLNLSWSIQNGIITLVNFNGDDNTGAYLLSPATGLIGSPQALSGETRKAKDLAATATPGWKLEALLLPTINPLAKIFVQSSEIVKATQFTAYAVTHTGDTHGVDWTTVIEVKE